MEAQPGLRVVRGPDWEWGDQDGGEGHVGTVVEVGEPSVSDGGRAVVVQWDCGERSRYRCGLERKYDLRVMDSGPAGVKHPTVTCDGCRQRAISGIRWKCAPCHDYDLCTGCYMEGKHNCDHVFLCYAVAQQRSRMQPRKDCRAVEIKGAFPGADVIRGINWNHEDKDGGEGEIGKIIVLSDVENESFRGLAEVEWRATGLITTCRIGHEGNVDIKCIAPEAAGKYFIDHLPVLGGPTIPPGPGEFSSGDVVQVQLDMEVFMLLQQEHGGWNDQMSALKGRNGIIHHIKDSGDLLVTYRGDPYVINPAAVVKAEIKPAYKPGDIVRIMDDRAEVTKLQKGHGEWNEDMLDSLGQTGVVQHIDSVGDARVLVKDRLWWFNSECLSVVAEDSADTSKDTQSGQTQILGEDVADLRRRLELLKTIGDSDVLAHAALLGEEQVIKEYLDEYPNDINAKFSNKTALHCAAAAGRASIVKLLIDYQADIHAKDENGLTPLHHCALRNEREAAVVLLEAGADPNLQAEAGMSPIAVAIHKESSDVVELLANYPKIDLCLPNQGGDTPLHIAVMEQSLSSVTTLLRAGADVTAVNFKLCTPLHVAAELGFTVLVEEFLRHRPELINLKGSEINLSPLHFAAVRDKLEVADFLLKRSSCDMEARNSTLLTPFLMTIMSGSLRVLERLVGFGADLGAVDDDGDTALHLVLRNSSTEYELPTDDCPELKKVQQILGDSANPQAILCCFLVHVGVDMETNNYAGLSPLEICDPVLAVTIASFAEEHKGESKFHGSLKQSEVNSVFNTETQETTNFITTKSVPVLGDLPLLTQELSEELGCPTHQKNSPEKSGSEALHIESDSVTTNHTPCSPATSTGLSANSHTDTDSSCTSAMCTSIDGPVCMLCDEPAKVRLLPCGHEIICLMCSKRAKKCLQCKAIVTARVNLSAL